MVVTNPGLAESQRCAMPLATEGGISDSAESADPYWFVRRE